MERYRTFDAPHKGLRNALSQLLFLAGNTDYKSAEGVTKIYALGKKIFKLMHGHADDENTIVLAALESRMQGAASHDTDDHEVIEAKQAELEAMLDSMHEMVSAGGDATVTGKLFFNRFSTFFGEYLLHMGHEETVTQQLLWDNFTDAELHEFTIRIVSKFSIDKTLEWYSFMIPAMDPVERAGLYNGARMAMPVEVFEVVDAAVKQFLTEVDYAALKATIEKNQIALS